MPYYVLKLHNVQYERLRIGGFKSNNSLNKTTEDINIS